MSKEKIPQQESLERPRHETIFDLYKEKVTEGRVGSLIKVVLSDPNTKTRFYQLFEDKKILDPVIAGTVSEKITPLMTTLMRDDFIRSLLMDAMLGDMKDDSDAFKKVIEDKSAEFEKGSRENIEKELVFNRGV